MEKIMALAMIGAIGLSLFLAYRWVLRPLYIRLGAFFTGYYTHKKYEDPVTGRTRLYFKNKYSRWFYQVFMDFVYRAAVIIAVILLLSVRLYHTEGYALTKPDYEVGEQVLFLDSKELSLNVGSVASYGDLKNGWDVQTKTGDNHGIVIGAYVPCKVTAATLPGIALFSITSKVSTIFSAAAQFVYLYLF